MKKPVSSLLMMILFTFILSACGAGSSPSTPSDESLPEGEQDMSFKMTSPAFAQGEPIPQKYACNGQEVSPPLQWDDVPQTTQSLALIMDDPDAPAGTWVHWVLYNLPAGTRALSENIPPDISLPDGSRHGKNSWGRFGYGGPCPPSGVHRYFFKLYALDIKPDLPAGASKEQLLATMEGHILGQAEVMGTYSK